MGRRRIKEVIDEYTFWIHEWAKNGSPKGSYDLMREIKNCENFDWGKSFVIETFLGDKMVFNKGGEDGTGWEFKAVCKNK